MNRLNLFPEENETSQSLIQNGENNLFVLRKLSGEAFAADQLHQLEVAKKR